VKSIDKFLEFHISKLTADRPLPIDLQPLAADIGLVVEEREMIPEAAIQTVEGQFHIYVQSNFKDLPGTALRRRFTLAHEIGHTFFYEQRDGELKPRKDSPRGDALEIACHKAASMILVPSNSLRSELRQRQLSNAEGIVQLAGRFEVSLEAMIRRLQESGSFENAWTVVLARRTGGILAIEYAAYSHWLIPHIVAPERGTAFTEWFRGAQQPDGTLKKKIRGGSLDAVPKEANNSLVIFELRLHT
jgi:Zn-dependent peptidase ImmA (M78 family)